jgi:acyl-coenzyme A thioesterase PaaI-like protein
MEPRRLDFAAIPINTFLGLDLRAATLARGEVIARSSVIRRGRSIAVAQVDVRQGDQLVLTGLFTYIVLGPAT